MSAIRSQQHRIRVTNYEWNKPIYQLLPTEIEGFDSLAELALDMRRSGITLPTKCGGRRITPCGRSRTPLVVLQTVSREPIERELAAPIFRKDLDRLVEAIPKAAEVTTWFQKNHSASALP